MPNKPLAFVVEDDPLLNKLFATTLQNDFELVQLYDGNDALLELERKLPALIVLDMNLPGAPGAKILEYVRASEKFSACRVILATADALQAAALQDQADLVLLKPVSPAQLRDLSSRMIPRA